MSQTVALQKSSINLRKSRPNFPQSLTTYFLALLCVVGIGALQLPQLNKLTSSREINSAKALEKEIQSEKLSLNILGKMPTFRFDNLMADWVFLKFLQYFGDDEGREKTGYSLSPDYFEVILKRDPRFLNAYLFLSTSTSLYSGMPEKSVELMEQGLKSLSPQVPQRSYYIWRYKGTDELLFLGDGQRARRSFETAAQWASAYSDVESRNVEFISRGTAKFLARNPKSRSAQIAAWTTVYNNPVDDKTRKAAIRKIEALGGKVSVNSQGSMQVTLPKED